MPKTITRLFLAPIFSFSFILIFNISHRCHFSGAGKSTLMSALAFRNMSMFLFSHRFVVVVVVMKFCLEFSAGTIIRGEILVDNRPIGPWMHRFSGFVHQDDLFDGTLTVLEHLTFIVRTFGQTIDSNIFFQLIKNSDKIPFQANMKLDKRMTRQAKGSLVTTTLAKVGLLECCNTRIGDTVKGKTLSGGEKKRLSFAAELLTSPMLLYCDEPTTGLGTA